jgi:hypothetical protein
VGVETGASLRDHRKELSGTIGKQIGLANRWEPPEQYHPLMLTEAHLHSLNAHMNKEIDRLTRTFSQATHDMRETERRQGVFLTRNRDPYLSDWLRPPSGLGGAAA